MRTCSKCGTEKPLESFWAKVRGPGGKDTQCAECKRAYHKQIYDNSPNRRSDIRRNTRLWIKTKRKLVQRHKEFVGCQDCGGKYPYYVLDYDHRDGITKKDTVSRMAGGSAGMYALKVEIRKCDVLCANCHRERTHGG